MEAAPAFHPRTPAPLDLPHSRHRSWLRHKTSWLRHKTSWLRHKTSWLRHKTSWLRSKNTWPRKELIRPGSTTPVQNPRAAAGREPWAWVRIMKTLSGRGPWLENAVCECGVSEGQLHVFGCRREICPFCELQLLECDCVYDLIGLRHRG